MDTDSFKAYIKTDYIYKDSGEDVETTLSTSNYELHGLLTEGKNKKVIGSMRVDLGGKMMVKFVRLRAITYSYLTDDGGEGKKAPKKRHKRHRKVRHKKKT